MARFVVDAYVWIEYFNDSEKGRKVAFILENSSHEIFTSNATVAEIINKCLRTNKDAFIAMNCINDLSLIINITQEIAFTAGQIHFECKKKNKDFGMLDAFVAATAKKMKAKILTGDDDFKHFREAVFI